MIFRNKLTSDTNSRESKRVLKRGIVLISCFLLFFLGFLVGIYVFIPNQQLQDKISFLIEQNAPIKFSMGHLRLVPLASLTADSVLISPPGGAQPQIVFETVKIGPWWRGLFTGRPGLNGSAVGLNGLIDFQIDKDRLLNVNLSGIDFDIPVNNPSTVYVVVKNLSGLAKLRVPFQEFKEGILTLDIQELFVRGLSSYLEEKDTLFLGRMILQVEGTQGAFRLDQLNLSGGAIEMSGTGDILVNNNFANSRVNLNLKVIIRGDAPAALESLIDLIGTKLPDGSYNLRLRGALNQIVPL